MTPHGARTVHAFIDLRSPYSFLALKPARALEQRAGCRFEWWPFITDFQSAYGGEIEERSARDVAKLRYLYMDCRRLAKRQGLTVRSTVKLWDARAASQAMLFAKAHGRLWAFCDPLLTAFWRREFDLESADQLAAALANAGLPLADWHRYRETTAPQELDAAAQLAERLGVFGAPTFVYDDEVFWGGDRLDLLEGALTGEPTGEGPAPSISDLT